MKNRQKQFYEINLTEDALLNKISIFAKKDGYLDQESIYNACINKLHLTSEQAREAALNTIWGAYYQNLPGISYTFLRGIYGQFTAKDAIPLFRSAFDGEFYNFNGAFNENLFKLLEQRYAEKDSDGEKIISKKQFKAFLAKETQVQMRILEAQWFFQSLDVAINENEFDAIFDKLISRYKENDEGESIGFVTLRNLKLWYINGNYLAQQIQTGALPATKPTL